MWGDKSRHRLSVLLILPLLAGCIPGKERRRPAPPPVEAPPPEPRLPTDLIGLIEREPVWSVQAANTNAREIADSVYTVQSGDTLRSVGNRTGAGSEMLARVNGLTAPYVIRPGQKLKVPGGRYHLVAEGETGIAIARAYGVDWGEVVALNYLSEPYTLRRGQRLRLPGRAEVANQSMEQRAAAFRIDIDDILTGGQPATDDSRPVTATTTIPKPIPSNVPIGEPTKYSGSFAWPLRGGLLHSFGPGASGFVNEGIDIKADRGTPIQAAADGVVAYAGDEIAVFGGLILISHGSGWVTAYGHADRLDVVRGQKVIQGQVIGAVGESGFVKEPQLHFEMRKDRKPVNPLFHLPAQK